MKPHETEASYLDWDLDLGYGEHLIDVLYGIGSGYNEAFYSVGITTVEQISNIEGVEGIDDLIRIPGRVLRRIKQQALSYMRNEIYQVEPFEFPAGGLSSSTSRPTSPTAGSGSSSSSSTANSYGSTPMTVVRRDAFSRNSSGSSRNTPAIRW